VTDPPDPDPSPAPAVAVMFAAAVLDLAAAGVTSANGRPVSSTPGARGWIVIPSAVPVMFDTPSVPAPSWVNSGEAANVLLLLYWTCPADPATGLA
jgi:hypothetical protein